MKPCQAIGSGVVVVLLGALAGRAVAAPPPAAAGAPREAAPVGVFESHGDVGAVLHPGSVDKDVSGHPQNKDVTLRRLALDSKKVEVLGRFFGGQGTINVPCWSPDGRRIAFVTYQLVP